jgi:thioredoxin-related protein
MAFISGRNILMKNFDKLVIVFALCLIVFSLSYKKFDVHVTPKINVILVPKPVLTTNIFYNEYDKAKTTADTYAKKLVLIFGAAWCPYCKDLKKDSSTIREFDDYIVCFIDIDNNKELTNKFQIKELPTSIIVYKNNEEVRKSGYKKNEYIKWLKLNQNHGENTWSKLSS